MVVFLLVVWLEKHANFSSFMMKLQVQGMFIFFQLLNLQLRFIQLMQLSCVTFLKLTNFFLLQCLSLIWIDARMRNFCCYSIYLFSQIVLYFLQVCLWAYVARIFWPMLKILLGFFRILNPFCVMIVGPHKIDS